MAVNQEMSFRVLYSLARQLIYKGDKSGSPCATPQATILHQLTKSPGYTVLPNPQPSPATGTATRGGWTGTYCKRATGGRTRSWVGNHLQTPCKGHILTSRQKRTRSLSQRNRDMNILSKSQMKGGLHRRHMQITLCMSRRNSSILRRSRRNVRANCTYCSQAKQGGMGWKLPLRVNIFRHIDEPLGQVVIVQHLRPGNRVGKFWHKIATKAVVISL